MDNRQIDDAILYILFYRASITITIIYLLLFDDRHQITITPLQIINEDDNNNAYDDNDSHSDDKYGNADDSDIYDDDDDHDDVVTTLY